MLIYLVERLRERDLEKVLFAYLPNAYHGWVWAGAKPALA